MAHESFPAEPLDYRETPFRMVAIYDSPETSLDAAQAAEVVLRELGEEVAVVRSSWAVDALERSSVCDFAADVAAHADMILIALSSDTAPDGLKHWIAQWEKSRALNGGLLALIAGDSPASRDLAEYLNETAITANMDFLCRKKPRY